MTRKKITLTIEKNMLKEDHVLFAPYDQKNEEVDLDTSLLWPETDEERKASTDRAVKMAEMATQTLHEGAVQAGVQSGEISEVVEKSTSFLTSKLKEAGHGAKFLMAMGGVAPQLIKGPDGKVDMKGLMIDVGETLAVAGAQAIPGVGPFLSGVLSVVFQFINSPKQVNEFAILSEQLENYVDEKILSSELQLLQSQSLNIQDSFNDFTITLLNLASPRVQSNVTTPNPTTAVNDLISKKNIIRDKNIEACLTFEKAAWSGIGYYALMSKVKLTTLMALTECDIFKKTADESTITTLHDEMDNLVLATNQKINERAHELLNMGKHKWNDIIQGFTLSYTQGLVLWLNEVKMYLQLRYNIQLGDRLTCEIFSPYCKDKDYDNENIFALTQHEFFTRSTPPAQIQAQWLQDNLLGFEMSHPIYDGEMNRCGGLQENDKLAELSNLVQRINEDMGAFGKEIIDPNIKSGIFKLQKIHHGINSRVSPSGARGICQFDISDAPAQLSETKNGVVTQSLTIEPDSMFEARPKEWVVGEIVHYKNLLDRLDRVPHIEQRDMQNVILFGGNSDSENSVSNIKSGNGISSYFLSGMYRGTDEFNYFGLSATDMVKQNKGVNVGGFVIRHNSSYDFEAVIDGKKKVIELDACCGLINEKSDGTDFDHNDPFIGYKVIHVNKEKEDEYQIGFLIKKITKKAVTATVNLVAGVADASQENSNSNVFFKEGNFTLTINQDNGKTKNISHKNIKFNFPGLVNDAKSKYTIIPFQDSVEFSEGDGSILVILRSSVPFLFCKLAFTLQDSTDVKGNDKEIIVNAALGTLMTLDSDAESSPEDYKYNFMLFDEKSGYEIKDPFGKIKVSIKGNAAKFIPLSEPNELATQQTLDPLRSDASQLYKTNPDSLTYFRKSTGRLQEVFIAQKGVEFYSYINYDTSIHVDGGNCIGMRGKHASTYQRSFVDVVAIDALKRLQTEDGLNRPVDSMCYYFGDLLVFQGNMCTKLTVENDFFKQADNDYYHSKRQNAMGYAQLLSLKKNIKAEPIINIFPAIEGDDNFKDGVGCAVYLGEYVKGKNKELDKLISENILSGNPADGSGVFMFFKDKYIHVLVQEKKQKNPLSISVWKACTIKSKLNISS